jgi:hypothetical protein
LYRAAQPADPDHPTSEEHRRRVESCRIAGWLFFARYGALSAAIEPLEVARAPLELARAIRCFEPIARDPTTMPEPLRAVLGPNADLPGRPGALDKVVSSYTPTLRALAHARARRPAGARRQLTVALTRTPGLPDLPGAVDEAAVVPADPLDRPPLIDQDATVTGVMAALPTATWAHFACHATTDLAAPSLGGLHLSDGVVPLAAIARLRLTDAELGYLAACSTANPGWRHADEALHLASAFQLAGFRNVIASLWPLSDHVATFAAATFYGRLPAGPAADQAAIALHHTSLDLREEYPDRPDLWAALIHSGA